MIKKLWDLITRNVWQDAQAVGLEVGFMIGEQNAQDIISALLLEHVEDDFELGLMLALEHLGNYSGQTTGEETTRPIISTSQEQDD